MFLRSLTLLTLLAAQAVTPDPPLHGLPVRTTAKGNIAADPVNIAFEGSRSAILSAFSRAGWVKADPLSLRDDARLAVDAVTHHSYPAAPVSSLYLFGRSEDFAVEHELGTVAKRDHARLWESKRSDPVTHLELWIGDAAQDNGIEVLRRHHVPIGTTHHINPNLDAERSLIVTLLRRTGMVRTVLMEPGMGRTTDGKNAGGDRFYTDGQLAVIVLNG